MTLSFARSLLVPLGVALLVIAPSAAQAGAIPVVPFNEVELGTLGEKGDAALDEEGTRCSMDGCGYGAPLSDEEKAKMAAEDAERAASSAGSQETSAAPEASGAAPEASSAASEASIAAPEESSAASEASSAAPEESSAASEASSEETSADEESTESEWSDDE